MNFALDIFLICVMAACIITGIRRGFVRSAARFVGAVISACLSAVLGGIAAQWLYDLLFRDALIEKIRGAILSISGPDAAQAVLDGLPDFIVRALDTAGVTKATLTGSLASQSGEAAAVLAEALEPVFVSFLKVLTVFGLFLLFLVLTRILANLLAAAFELPLLSQVNSALGGLFGFLMALLLLWVLISALKIFLPMTSLEMQASLSRAVERSVLMKVIAGMNPLGGMFR